MAACRTRTQLVGVRRRQVAYTPPLSADANSNRVIMVRQTTRRGAVDGIGPGNDGLRRHSTPSTAATATPPPAVPCNLLLVSGNQCWTRAVQEAAAEIGGGVSRCDARDAVIRLACITPHYSHLLLHPDSADGLLNELVTLTAGDRESSTEMLLLGSAGAVAATGSASSRRRIARSCARPSPPARHHAPGGGHARCRTARSARRRDDRDPLPADRPYGRPASGRAGGAGPAEPSDPRHNAAGRVRAADRGCRASPRA